MFLEIKNRRKSKKNSINIIKTIEKNFPKKSPNINF